MATTVIVQQPTAGGTGNPLMVSTIEGHRNWTTGLFDCFTDIKSCILGYFCLPCTVCNVATRTGECCCMPFFVPGGTVVMRTRIRTLGGIQGSACNDFCALACCGPCAVCQMQRELDNMGVPWTWCLQIMVEETKQPANDDAFSICFHVATKYKLLHARVYTL